MTTTLPTFNQSRLLLALLLFLVGQVALALHSHDLSLHTVDAEECVVCLVTSSDNPAPGPETPYFNVSAQNTKPLPALKVQVAQPQQIPLQPRAPPLLLF